MLKVTRHAIAAGLLLGTIAVSSASDDGLYDKPVDPNSAFVRILMPGATVAVIDGKSLDELDGGLSPYVNVQPGAISVSAGEATGTITVAPGGYYTLTWLADGSSLRLQDTAPSDPSKAEVYLYNLSDKQAVNLFVPAAKVDAIKDVAMNGSKAVALKAPLTLDVELQDGSTTIAKVAGLDLKRKSGISVILTGSGANYSAVAIENSFYRQ